MSREPSLYQQSLVAVDLSENFKTLAYIVFLHFPYRTISGMRFTDEPVNMIMHYDTQTCTEISNLLI